MNAKLFKSRNFVSFQIIQILCREVNSNNIRFCQLVGEHMKANNTSKYIPGLHLRILARGHIVKYII